jgi:hypothetical protein
LQKKGNAAWSLFGYVWDVDTESDKTKWCDFRSERTEHSVSDQDLDGGDIFIVGRSVCEDLPLCAAEWCDHCELYYRARNGRSVLCWLNSTPHSDEESNEVVCHENVSTN